MTCGLCTAPPPPPPCVDALGEAFCKPRRDLCGSSNKVMNHCHASCGTCDATRWPSPPPPPRTAAPGGVGFTWEVNVPPASPGEANGEANGLATAAGSLTAIDTAVISLAVVGVVALVLFFGVRTWRRQRRRGKRFTTSQLGKRKANLPGEVHLRDFDGASGLSRQSTELELPHSNGGGGAGARAHQPLHDEVSLPGTDDGEPTASVERI